MLGIKKDLHQKEFFHVDGPASVPCYEAALSSQPTQKTSKTVRPLCNCRKHYCGFCSYEGNIDLRVFGGGGGGLLSFFTGSGGLNCRKR